MAAPSQSAPQLSRRHTRRLGNIAIQIVTLAVIVAIADGAIFEAVQNLARAHITSGFGFWNKTAGFDISQALIAYSPSTSTFGRAFWVGLLNTLLVAGIGIVLATVLGFAIGIARLSPNWLLARLAGGYVELIRNLPLLFQILFWYLAVLGSLPLPRASYSLFGLVYLNNRGIIVPAPVAREGAGYVLATLLLAIVAAGALRAWAVRRQELTGRPFPAFWTGLGLIVGAALTALAALGFP